MILSVIICTRNRAASLSRTLDRMESLAIPPGLRWELIIVDNGSTDATPAVVEERQARLPIRRVFEGRAGLSNARNAGVEAARGDYILWTDDDVLVDPDWLAAYATAFARWPEAAVFGGKTQPLLEPPTPDWFARSTPLLADLLAIRDFGDEPVPLACDLGVVPYGLNYAIRASEQRAFPYDPDLGVAPGRSKGGEETSVITAIMRSGATGYWIPDAKVTHVIPDTRQTEAYVAQYYRGRGETVSSYRGKTGLKLVLPVAKRSLKAAGAYLLYRLNRGREPSAWLPHLKEFAFQSGWISEACQRPA